MTGMSIGTFIDNGGPVSGLYQQIGGLTTGNNLTLGEEGRIVLGIGGPSLGADYSQIHVLFASLKGNLEARFVDGYLPQNGDVFDLVLGSNISGNYSLSITGINPADYPNLKIIRSRTMIRLSFIPEPSAAVLLYLALAGTVISTFRHINVAVKLRRISCLGNSAFPDRRNPIRTANH